MREVGSGARLPARLGCANGHPPLLATEHVPLSEKIIHLHHFIGRCDWYVAELDDDTWEAFGRANLGDPQNAEWGYFSLPELEAVVVGSSYVVERDLHWTRRPFEEVIPHAR